MHSMGGERTAMTGARSYVGPEVLGAGIRAARILAGKTQRELAQAARIDVARLSKIERALIRPSHEEFARLWRVLSL